MRVDMNGDCDIGFIQMEMCFLNYLKENQPTVYERTHERKAVYGNGMIFVIPITIQIFALSKRIMEMGGRAQKKQENLRALLSGEYKESFADHSILTSTNRFTSESGAGTCAKVFQSAMMPFSLEFVIEGSTR